ncbi:hypothetical protein PCANC_02863 [Puccinia coronata f. sp. avenae]|uniref:Uncharacterized protein n=1 Tax=Puccinia coronata f. sp. avenae TaxID=200324 RepID=A0A2N5W436_9BASI|nr:hypothetical protein PCASD_24383 [Puccinia coronata f. sp. avenae]PLW56991.1 hypothetical protein PCANC_02863 [Puccinia coronata f. sp. avenae]
MKEGFPDEKAVSSVQSQPRERWLAVIRSFRQPLPPISDHPTNHQQEDALHAPNKPKKQRALYCLRHSGRPGQLVAMIEDADAPSRLALNAAPPHLHLSPLLNIMNHKQTENPLPQTHDKQMGDAALDESHHAPSDQPFLQDNGTEAGKTPVPIHTAQESTDMAVDDETSAIRNPRVTTKEEPSHYRVSLVSVPDSFEQLLSSAICATQSTLVPSAWCPRPNMVAIEGMVWGIYSSSFESEIGSGSNLGAIPSNFSSKETQPDWWIRLGTVTNKGATSGNTSLPWLILELECAASPIELDYSSEFLESVMHAILKPNAQLLIKPFRPTEQNFLEAGLTPEHDPAHSTHPPKTSCLQNGYSMLMLAKQERLI